MPLLHKFVRAIALAGTSIGLAACHFAGDAKEVTGGAVIERDVPIAAFERLAVSGPFDVEVKADGKPGLHVSGGENFIAASEFVVEDGTLKIRTREKNIRWTWGSKAEKMKIVVTGGGTISGASIAGTGNVAIDRVKAGTFAGEVAGSGNLDVRGLEAGDATFEIAGSGNIKTAGTARSVEMEIAGSGDIDGERLVARTAKASIAGSGNIAAHATETAKAEIMGSGDIRVTGGAKCDVSKMGSGRITCS